MCWMGFHIGNTCRIRMNDPCAAAMRPSVKSLRPLVQAGDCDSDPVSDHQRPGEENAGLRVCVSARQESGVRRRDGVRRTSRAVRHHRHLLRCCLLRDTQSHQDSASKHLRHQNLALRTNRDKY